MITWIDVKPTFPSSLGNGYAEVHHKWGIGSKPAVQDDKMVDVFVDA